MSELADLAEMVRAVFALDRRIEHEAEQEKELKAERRDLVEVVIPEMLLQAGVSEITVDGHRIRIKPKHRHTLAEGRKDAAFDWMEEHGHGAMVERRVSISFGHKSEHEADALAGELQRRFPTAEVVIERHVPPARVGSFLGELLRDGKPVPEKTFGLHLTVEAEIRPLK